MRGFTAIELMVTVAILAVLAAIAAPSFTPLIERWRVRQVAEELQSTLYFARSEAIKRGGDVSITASSSTDWSSGWSVLSGATPLQVTAAPTRVTIELASTNGSIAADRWGRLRNNSINDFVFRLYPEGKASTDAAAASLCISAGGQIKRLNTGTDAC